MKRHHCFRVHLHHSLFSRLLLSICSFHFGFHLFFQLRPSLCISFTNSSPRDLLLFLRHFVPICNLSGGAVRVNDDRSQFGKLHGFAELQHRHARVIRITCRQLRKCRVLAIPRRFGCLAISLLFWRVLFSGSGSCLGGGRWGRCCASNKGVTHACQDTPKCKSEKAPHECHKRCSA